MWLRHDSLSLRGYPPSRMPVGDELGKNMRYWLWVFGDVAGLQWVLEHSEMAFTEHQALRASQAQTGDQVVLFVTRGAFRNPTRDTSRLAGLVEVSGSLRKRKPVQLGEREFRRVIPFKPIHLFEERTGPAVSPLVEQLERVKNPKAWGQYFRQSPIQLSEHDYKIFDRAIRNWAKKLSS